MTIARILPLVLLIALALAPLRMAGAEAAVLPHHGSPAMAAAHCLPEPAPADEEQPRSAETCMIACAALPVAALPLPERLAAARAPDEALRASPLTGLTPEAATPPPRAA